MAYELQSSSYEGATLEEPLYPSTGASRPWAGAAEKKALEQPVTVE